RGAAQAVTFVTGHAAHGEPDLDWTALARPNQTVVVYMGVSTASLIAERLTAAGRVGSTPALIVENASRADERRILTTLAGLALAAEGLKGPVLLMVGEAMAMADVEPDNVVLRQAQDEVVSGAAVDLILSLSKDEVAFPNVQRVSPGQ
ncbi:MAG TPA: SAM-dependent methyltransferase, partial [Caulobacter sp.]|nr:SAM-dependent methyltransferase [Caulobacter sp.]